MYLTTCTLFTFITFKIYEKLERTSLVSRPERFPTNSKIKIIKRVDSGRQLKTEIYNQIELLKKYWLRLSETDLNEKGANSIS